MSTNEDSLRRLADALERVADAMEAKGEFHAPNFQFPLSSYRQFNWSSIQAEVMETDANGPTLVKHKNRIYKRRTGDGKFGDAIWYSFALSDKNYVSLIKFSEKSAVEPVSRGVLSKI